MFVVVDVVIAIERPEATMWQVWQSLLAWHALLLLALWVPFAIVAGIVDTRRSETGREFRAELAHPIRTVRMHWTAWQLTHHAHAR